MQEYQHKRAQHLISNTVSKLVTWKGPSGQPIQQVTWFDPENKGQVSVTPISYALINN